MLTQNHNGSTESQMSIASVMQECIQNCTDCYQICSSLISHCLEKGGAHADAEHIRLLEDCSRVCNLAADFMIRHSQFHTRICDACSDICMACAKSCEAIADDDMMLSCAEMCQMCAESCKEMAKMH